MEKQIKKIKTSTPDLWRRFKHIHLALHTRETPWLPLPGSGGHQGSAWLISDDEGLKDGLEARGPKLWSFP